MNSFEQTFLSPQPGVPAYYFYLTIAALIFLAMAILDVAVGIYKNKVSLFDGFILLGPFLIYFTNRLLICTGALN